VARDVLPQRIAWSVSVAPVRPPLLPPWPSHTRPLQPRAPPETSV
jgi:hypothetical protein